MDCVDGCFFCIERTGVYVYVRVPWTRNQYVGKIARFTREPIYFPLRVFSKDPRLLLLAMRDADLLDVLCSGVFVAVLRLPRDRHRGLHFTYLLSQPMAALRSVCLSSSWVCVFAKISPLRVVTCIACVQAYHERPRKRLRCKTTPP
jgi:hypothetical protein